MGFALQMAIDDRLRSIRLRLEPCPIRKVAVPLDERRDGAALADDDVEELPYGIRYRAVMAVNEQKLALVIRLPGMAGEVNLADVFKRKIGEIVERRKAMVGGRNENVVDVEQQAAPGAPNQLRDERRLAHRRFPKNEIGGRVLKQELAPNRLLHLVYMIANPSERRLGVGKRQQIVEVRGAVG